jgi:hypothetical protein
LAGIDDPAAVMVVHLPKRMTVLQGLLSRGFMQNVLAYNLHVLMDRDLARREPLFFRREL